MLLMSKLLVPTNRVGFQLIWEKENGSRVPSSRYTYLEMSGVSIPVTKYFNSFEGIKSSLRIEKGSHPSTSPSNDVPSRWEHQIMSRYGIDGIVSQAVYEISYFQSPTRFVGLKIEFTVIK